jgi:hypothetical protein
MCWQPSFHCLVYLPFFNANVVTHFSKKFLNNTNYEANDLRMLPVVVPTTQQLSLLEQLAQQAIRVQNKNLQRANRTRDELEEIQVQVNEAVEELYGVKGLGPFNEF